jgi:hypothetical protein
MPFFALNIVVLISATRTVSGANKKCPQQDESKGSEHSSLSQTDDSFSPYARLRAEHPYDKLRSECQLTWFTCPITLTENDTLCISP